MSIEAEPLETLRRLCLALPGTTERLSHGEATWFVGDKKVFVTFDNDHHHLRRIAFWCAAPIGAQDALVGSDPIRFFVPPYVGQRGWLGVRVDIAPDWDEDRQPRQRRVPDGGAEAARGRARRRGSRRLGKPAMDRPALTRPTEPTPDERNPDDPAGNLERDDRDHQERGDGHEQARDQQLLELRQRAGLP